LRKSPARAPPHVSKIRRNRPSPLQPPLSTFISVARALDLPSESCAANLISAGLQRAFWLSECFSTSSCGKRRENEIALQRENDRRQQVLNGDGAVSISVAEPGGSSRIFQGKTFETSARMVLRAVPGIKNPPPAHRLKNTPPAVLPEVARCAALAEQPGFSAAPGPAPSPTHPGWLCRIQRHTLHGRRVPRFSPRSANPLARLDHPDWRGWANAPRMWRNFPARSRPSTARNLPACANILASVGISQRLAARFEKASHAGTRSDRKAPRSAATIASLPRNFGGSPSLSLFFQFSSKGFTASRHSFRDYLPASASHCSRNRNTESWPRGRLRDIMSYISRRVFPGAADFFFQDVVLRRPVYLRSVFFPTNFCAWLGGTRQVNRIRLFAVVGRKTEYSRCSIQRRNSARFFRALPAPPGGRGLDPMV